MCLLSIRFGVWPGYTIKAKIIAANELFFYDAAEQEKLIFSGG